MVNLKFHTIWDDGLSKLYKYGIRIVKTREDISGFTNFFSGFTISGFVRDFALANYKKAFYLCRRI